MTPTDEIIAKNTKKLEAFIDGDGESVAIADIDIIRDDCTEWKYRLEAGGVFVYVDDIEIWGYVVHFMKNGGLVACMTLVEE